MNAPIGDSFGALLGLVALAVGLALYVWTALALAAMFRKMGEAPYKGWVPVLNVATVLGWGGFSPWLILIGLFPVLGPIALWALVIISAHRINPGFGYGGGMTVLAAVLFVVWASILGFGPSRWLGARASGAAAASREQPRASLGGVFADLAPTPQEAAVVSELPPGPAPLAAAPDAAVPAGRSGGAREDDDLARLFAPPEAAAAPAWTPPEMTVPPSPASPAAAPPAAAPPAAPPSADAVPTARAAGAADADALDDPAVSAPPAPAAVVRPPAPAPVSASAAVRAGEAGDDDAAWPSEIDDVSAIAPSPFPPSSGAGWRHAMPPVTDDAPIDFVPGRRSTALPSPHDAVEATGAEAPAPRVSAAAAAARASQHPSDDAASEVPVSAATGSAPAPAADPAAAPEGASDAAEPPLRRARPWPAFAVAPNEPDGFPELSGEVSAVIGSPAAGSPRSAAGAVAAQHLRGESVDDDIDQTVITRRVRAAVWQLVPASGAPVAITADVVILGRRPVADAAFPKAQLIAVAGDALTVSKTHARLERHDEVWTITDLASTNGVLVRTFMGEEVEVEPGSKIDAGERFFLGDEEFHLARIER